MEPKNSNEAQTLFQKNIDTIKRYKFKQFLVMKLACEQIVHKKIVHIMLLRYMEFLIFHNFYYKDFGQSSEDCQFIFSKIKSLPSLTFLNLHFEGCKLGIQQENIEIISRGFYQLPQSLNYLQIRLGNNELGVNEYYMKLIGTGIKYLPANLKTFIITLSDNKLGKNPQNCKYLKEGFKNLPRNLETFILTIAENFLGKNQQCVQYLFEGLMELPDTIRELKLFMRRNLFGVNPENMEIIGQFLRKLPQSLKYFLLGLSRNQIGGEQNDLEPLQYGLQNLPSSLQKFEFYLGNNDIGKIVENQQVLGQILMKLPSVNLRFFGLYLSETQLYQNPLNLKFLGEGLKNLPQSLTDFELYIGSNQLQKDQQSLQFLGEGLQQLPKNLKKFWLILSSDGYYQNLNVGFLESIVKQLPSYLEYFELGLQYYNFGQYPEQLSLLLQYLGYLPCNLKTLQLDLMLTGILHSNCMEILEEGLIPVCNIIDNLNINLKNNYLSVQAKNKLNEKLLNGVEQKDKVIDIQY